VSRLRSQAGFTLPELMVAMSISLMTLLGVLGVLDVSVKQTNAVAGRVNATQRSRIVMDTITRQLRSQVCYNATTPALVSATDDSVRFHADLSSGATPIQQRELVFNATTKTIRERTWPGDGLTPLGFPTMTRDRLLIDDVVRRPAPDAAIFRYYAYNTLSPPQPKVLLPTPLNATDLARVAKIDIGFVTLPPGVKSTPLKPAASSVTLENEIYVRVADPNDPAPTPTCA
jgi:prepilin-type N-terminal cleavage/methylation domain-containing protein